MKFWRVAAVAVGLQWVPVGAHALAQQSSPGRTVDPRTAARMHVGALYLSPSISVDRLGYDSNVRNETGARVSDFVMSVQPQTKAWVPFGRRALVTSDVGVGLVYYKTFAQERSVDRRGSLRGEIFLRQITLFGETGASLRRYQPSDEVDEIDTRVAQRRGNLAAGVKVGLFRGLSTEVSAYRQTSGYDDQQVFNGVRLGQVLDRAEQGIRVRTQWRATSLTTLGVVAESRQDRFERTTGRDVDGYRVAATADLNAKAVISGVAEVGFRHFAPRNSVVPAFDGLVAKVAVSNRLSGATEARVGWDRDVEYSVSVLEPYYVRTRLSASLRRQIAGQYDAVVSASAGRAGYQVVSEPVALMGDRRRDETTTWGLDIGRRLGASRVGLGVLHTRSTSTRSESRRYDATRAGLSWRYAF